MRRVLLIASEMTTRTAALRKDGGVLTLAKSASDRGELVLLRRADGALELRVNGLFAMDTAETASERQLASAAIEAATARRGAADGSLSVLVGGLGLGFTVAALLDDARVGAVLVAEIEPDLVRWHRTGLVPSPHRAADARSVLDDPRVEVVVADVSAVVDAQPPHRHDLLLLDVDNGPGFLLYAANAPLYREPFLQSCAAAVRPGGAVAIWSASEAPSLEDEMGRVFETASRLAVSVRLNDRRTHYHLYVGRTRLVGDGRHAR
jgi:spermidine synthase